MSISNRNIYKPEISVNFEAQMPIGAEPELMEVSENLYEDRMTIWYEYVPSSYQSGIAVPLVLQMHGAAVMD